MSESNRKWIRTISAWLDTKFQIPGTKIKFGLDPILSIFPVVGDLTTYAVSLAIIYSIRKNGASGELLMRMLINSTVDVIFGSIPVLGTVFDVFFKSNERNLALLNAYYDEGKYQGSGKGLLILVSVVVALILAALIYASYVVLKAALNFLETYL